MRLDILKIDRYFIQDIEANDDNTALVKATLLERIILMYWLLKKAWKLKSSFTIKRTGMRLHTRLHIFKDISKSGLISKYIKHQVTI